MNKHKTIQTITYAFMALGAIYPIFKDAYKYITNTASQFGGGQMNRNSVFLAVLPGLLLLASVVMYKWPFSGKKEPVKIPGKAKSLGFKIMLEMCQFLVKDYRRLSSTDPENTKVPLTNNNWPELGGNKVWSYTQLSLWRNFLYYTRLLKTAKQAFVEMGWETDLPPLFKVPPELYG